MVSSDMGHPEEIKEDSSRQRGASSGWGRGRLDDQGAWPAQDGGVAGSGWGRGRPRDQGAWPARAGLKGRKEATWTLAVPHGAKVQRRRGL